MRIIRSIAALLAVVLLAGCGGDGFSPRELVGHWEFSTETSAILWRRDEIRVVLQEDGGFIRNYAVFSAEGRASDQLHSYTHAEGTYQVHGDTLVLETSLVERWNANSGSQMVQQPGPYAEERYRAKLVGNRLLLEEARDIEGKPVTFYHNYRRVDPSGDPRHGPNR